HVERAVVALRDADVRVVDDAHHHVGRAVGLVEAAAHLLRARLQLVVGGLQPQPARLGDVDAPANAAARGSGASVSMNELTENTALPAPGGPYPGGGCRPWRSSVSR